jgi:hypothetical protein
LTGQLVGIIAMIQAVAITLRLHWILTWVASHLEHQACQEATLRACAAWQGGTRKSTTASTAFDLM